jgi:hypothetical protein
MWLAIPVGHTFLLGQISWDGGGTRTMISGRETVIVFEVISV